MSGGPRQPSDARLDELERAIRALEARVAAVERSNASDDLRRVQTDPPNISPEARVLSDRASSPGADVDVRDAEPAETGPLLLDPALTAGFDAVLLMTLAGRTLMVLGGAYLLRALTESGIWPSSVGVVLGFAYAATWLVATDRSSRSGRWISAEFHGGTALMIALPLLWEAVTRFHLMAATTASIALTVVSVAALAVAVRDGLQTLAWLAVVGAMTSSLALTAATTIVLPFTVANIALGIVTLWIGYTADWIWLRWPVALLANVSVIALGVGATSGTASSSPAAIVAVQLLLLGAYVTSVAIRTLVRGRDVIPFEALQSTAALVVGFGGAIAVARATGIGGGLLVSIGLACGVGCYGVAFAFIARRQGIRRNFYFYTSMALVLILAGVALGLPYPGICWAVLAVLAAVAAAAAPAASEREQRAVAPGRLTLSIHAATYLIAASLVSGLLSAALRALVGPPSTQSPLSPQLLFIFAAGCVCWMILVRADSSPRAAYARVPRAIVAMLLATAAGAWLASLALSDATAAGYAATVRTIALAITALALAWLGRAPSLREAAWLVYPTLAAGGVKLLAEDFPNSSAATLFVALAMYGGALIAAPRLIRRQTA
jgi:hypothetical protein